MKRFCIHRWTKWVLVGVEKTGYTPRWDNIYHYKENVNQKRCKKCGLVKSKRQ